MAKYKETEKIKSGETLTQQYGRDRSDDSQWGQSVDDESMVDRGITHSIKNGDVPRDNG